MVQCKKCKLFLSMNKDDVIKCKGDCDGVFHKKCVRNNKQLALKEICEECLKNERSPPQNKDTNSSSKITVNPCETSGEKILEEVNKKLEVIYNMEKKLTELTDTVDFYAEMYQEMSNFKEAAEKKIKSLEQKNVFLEKYNRALEERVEELEMKEKEKCLEICGLENIPNENTKQVVQEVAKLLQVNPEDIEDAERVGKEKDGDQRPRIIKVKLRTKNARIKWMAAKKEHTVTNSKLHSNGSDKRIYINEDLPKQKRQLLWSTRNKLKEKGFQYIWVQNFNILAKKNNDETKIYKITTESDLEKF
ncbi:uncharacterized protein LOC113507654 [Trichoplusia ni]|uniref:Uncharacterized protein LOC113507654 n=1 Tax=Trichoplusia ni TaxID=7111 RepID=A0A7E5X1K4_TRINI|nr:uncharacterized protein LOC113507654 [Trichoplusia ni]